jgi:hypothetical protein
MAIGLAALGLLDHCALSIEPPVSGDPLGRAALRQRDEYDAGLTRDDALIPPIADTGAKAARAMQEGSTDVPPLNNPASVAAGKPYDYSNAPPLAASQADVNSWASRRDRT